MATSPTLRPDPLPTEGRDAWASPAQDPSGATVIDLDSLAVEDVLIRLNDAPALPVRLEGPPPRPPRIGAVAELVAACVAPPLWVGAVQLMPLSETTSSAAVIGGWVAMAAIVQRWNTRTRSTDP